MQGDASDDAADLDRQVGRGDLRGVIGVVDEGGEAEVISHALAIERPARAVEHGRAHRRTVDAGVGLADALSVAIEPRCKAEQVMAVAVGLGGNAVGVVGDDGVAMGRGKLDHRPRRLVQALGQGEEPVAHGPGRPCSCR